MTTTEQPALTNIQEVTGLIEARRIINRSAGYYFGGQLTSFAEELKELALRAICQVEKRVEITDATIRNSAYLMSTYMEGKSFSDSFIAAYRLLFDYIYPPDKSREHVDDCELLNNRDLEDIKQVLMAERSMVGSRYNELKEKLDLTTDYAKKFQNFTKIEFPEIPEGMERPEVKVGS